MAADIERLRTVRDQSLKGSSRGAMTATFIPSIPRFTNQRFSESDVYRLNPDNIDPFLHLRGSEVQQVCVGKFDLQLNLHPNGNISIWSRCEILDANGSVIDIWQDGARTANFQFTDLLGATVADVLIDDATTLRLQFTDGRQLLIFDTSVQFESFAVNDLIV